LSLPSNHILHLSWKGVTSISVKDASDVTHNSCVRSAVKSNDTALRQKPANSYTTDHSFGDRNEPVRICSALEENTTTTGISTICGIRKVLHQDRLCQDTNGCSTIRKWTSPTS